MNCITWLLWLYILCICGWDLIETLIDICFNHPWSSNAIKYDKYWRGICYCWERINSNFALLQTIQIHAIAFKCTNTATQWNINLFVPFSDFAGMKISRNLPSCRFVVEMPPFFIKPHIRPTSTSSHSIDPKYLPASSILIQSHTDTQLHQQTALATHSYPECGSIYVCCAVCAPIKPTTARLSKK